MKHDQSLWKSPIVTTKAYDEAVKRTDGTCEYVTTPRGKQAEGTRCTRSLGGQYRLYLHANGSLLCAMHYDRVTKEQKG